MVWDKQACTNRVDQDQTPQNVVSDRVLHCLLLIPLFLAYQQVVTMDLFKFQDKYKE